MGSNRDVISSIFWDVTLLALNHFHSVTTINNSFHICGEKLYHLRGLITTRTRFFFLSFFFFFVVVVVFFLNFDVVWEESSCMLAQLIYTCSLWYSSCSGLLHMDDFQMEF